MRLLRRIHNFVLLRYNSFDRYQSLQEVQAFVGNEFINLEVVSSLSNAIGRIDRRQVLYRSNGVDYRLVFGVDSTECGVIHVVWRELINMERNVGKPIECFEYGYWSEDGVSL